MEFVEPVESITLWYKLLEETQERMGFTMYPAVEQYLAGMLNEYVSRADIKNTIFADEWLNALGKSGALTKWKLRDVGDKALLYAGFFPKRAQRLNVDVRYFQEIGMSAYHHAHQAFEDERGQVFLRLSREFVFLKKFLWVMRGEADVLHLISTGVQSTIFH